MAGTFSKSARPKRPGAYFNFVAGEQQPVLENTRGTVAIPFTHDWGPAGRVVDILSMPDFLGKYGGASVEGAPYSDAYVAVNGAFRGEGLPGRGGASRVLGYRMLGTGSGFASRALAASGAGTGTLTVRGRYEGAFGNRLRVEVMATPGVAGSNDLVVYDGTTVLERFTHVAADIAGLAADIRANSNWIDYTAADATTALATGGPFALTGGADGAVAQADFMAAAAALEPFRFSLFAPANLTDAATRTALIAWAKSLNNAGKRFMSVFGGAAGESAATATARSAAINDPNFVNVGIGTYTDARLGDLSTAQLAPRVAGILARLGENENLTFTRMAGLTVAAGASVADILSAIDGGVVTFGRDSHPTAPVRIEKGVTAYVTEDAAYPLSVYSVPKFVRTVHSLEIDLTEWAELNIIGRVPISEGTREYIRAQMEARMAARELAGAIQPGWSVQHDTTPAPGPDDDFVALLYQFRFARSLEQILNTVVVG